MQVFGFFGNFGITQSLFPLRESIVWSCSTVLSTYQKNWIWWKNSVITSFFSENSYFYKYKSCTKPISILSLSWSIFSKRRFSLSMACQHLSKFHNRMTVLAFWKWPLKIIPLNVRPISLYMSIEKYISIDVDIEKLLQPILKLTANYLIIDDKSHTSKNFVVTDKEWWKVYYPSKRLYQPSKCL